MLKLSNRQAEQNKNAVQLKLKTCSLKFQFNPLPTFLANSKEPIMKKISFLLLGVCLLFPAALYLGNIADIPVSKKLVVYLRDVVGLSTSQKTPNSATVAVVKMPATYSHFGLVQSWRDLGSSNFADLLQLIAATPDNQEKWRAATDGFLSNPLHSAAFFSSSWSFWQVPQEKLTLIGYYQPWIDVLLLIQVAEVNGSYKALAIGITEPNASTAPTTPTAMAQQLTARLERAEHAFQTAILNPNAIANMLNPESVEKSANNLDLYISDLRSKLSANNAQNQDRSAILDWLTALQTGQVKEVQQLTSASNEWLKQLQVVELLKIDAEQWLLAASASSEAERVLLVQLRISGGKALVTEIKMWDAATAGGAQ